jgi:hypothetical protein
MTWSENQEKHLRAAGSDSLDGSSPHGQEKVRFRHRGIEGCLATQLVDGQRWQHLVTDDCGRGLALVTSSAWGQWAGLQCFNPRAPRGARLSCQHRAGHADRVSIHAPRVGCDEAPAKSSVGCSTFQSTRPACGATSRGGGQSAGDSSFNPRAPRGARRGGSTSDCNPQPVSIHAPRVGRDPFLPTYRGSSHCFNPRAPRGARRHSR